MSVKNGSSTMQIITALLATIPSLTYGIQIGWLSPMAPILQSAFSPAPKPLTDYEISWMAAALTLAAVPSVPFFSYVSDKYGRKISIILLSIFSSVSWTLKLWNVSPIGLTWARLFAGIAAAGTFLVIPVYIKEISEDKLRGSLGSLLMSSCNIGVVIVYILGMKLSYFWNQWVYLAICFIHILLFALMPESPAFLVKKGKCEAAKRAISWLRGLKEDDEIVLKEIDVLKIEDDAFKAAPLQSIIDILKDRSLFKALVMCLVLIGVQTLSGCFAIVNYAASIFNRAGGEWSSNVLALLVGTLQLSGSLVATGCIDKCGRKVLMSSSCAIISFCMASVATSFLLEHLQWGTLPQWLPVTSVCLCIFAYGVGLAPVPFVVMAEVFSFQVRARLSGVVMMFSWTNSTLIVFMFTPIANLCGDHVVFFLFAIVTCFGSVYTVLYVPETKGRSVEDLQMEFEMK